MRDNDWLKTLKVGDEVAIYTSAAGGGWYEIHKVTAVGQKFVVAMQERFRRNCRHGNGSVYGRSLNPVTDEIRTEVTDRNDRDRILRNLEESGFRQRYRFGDCWSRLSIDQLRRIAAILDEPKEGTDAQ